MMKLTAALLLLLPTLVFSKTWVINRDHSEIFFTVSYLKVSELTGRFNRFIGETEIDDSGVPKSLSVVIEAKSLDTGNDVRDGHLRRSEFFAVSTYPEISFQSGFIQSMGGRRYRANGKLTIKNVTREHAIDFTLSDELVDTWGYPNRMVKFETLIDRTQYGLLWNKTLTGKDYLVGELVKIRGGLQLQPGQALTPKSKHMIPDTPYIRNRERSLRGEAKAPESPVVQADPGSGGLPKATRSAPVVVKEVMPRPGRSLFWWIWFSILGLFGFFGVTLIGILGKKTLLRYYTLKYEETGRLGLLSDLVVIGLVLIYAYAFWVVGWAREFH